MIKVFRHIRKRLLREGKTGRYLKYAIGEIVLVVIGILIALSINNWNEWRKDRKIEKGILLEFRDNLERNIALIDIASAEIIEINQTTKTIIEHIEKKKTYPDTLIHHFEELGRSGSYLLKLNTNGYESLKNIGFEILSSKVIKNEILSLFETSYPSYTKQTEIVNAIWENNPMWWHDYFYLRPTESGLIPLNFNSLAEDKMFMTIVRTLESGRFLVLERMELCKRDTKRVLQLIKDELK